MKTGYVIFEIKGDYEQVWETVLPEGTTKEEAIKATIESFDRLAPQDKKNRTFELIYGAVNGNSLISEDDEDYIEAVRAGVNTWSGYTPIFTIKEDEKE